MNVKLMSQLQLPTRSSFGGYQLRIIDGAVVDWLFEYHSLLTNVLMSHRWYVKGDIPYLFEYWPPEYLCLSGITIVRCWSEFWSPE